MVRQAPIWTRSKEQACLRAEPDTKSSRASERRKSESQKLGNGAMQDLSTASVVPCRQAVAMGRTLECRSGSTYYSVLYMPGWPRHFCTACQVLRTPYTTHRDIKIPNGQLWRGLGACPIRSTGAQPGQNGGAFNWLRSLASAEGGKSWEHWARTATAPQIWFISQTQSSQLLPTLARRHGFFKSPCCLNPGRGWLYIHCTTLRKPPTGRRKDIRSNGAIFGLCLLSKARERPHSCHPHLRPQANRRRARPGPSNPAGVWSARPLNSILCCLLRRTPATA